jgi:membrane protease YdiL (CAAX protease family)
VQQTQMKDYAWIREMPLGDFVLIFLVGAVLAPISEEIFFRGLVFRPYLLTHGPLTAYAASGILFGLLHLNLEALVPIIVLALALAWLYQVTGSILPGILAHAINNGFAFVALYFLPPGLSP